MTFSDILLVCLRTALCRIRIAPDPGASLELLVFTALRRCICLRRHSMYVAVYPHNDMEMSHCGGSLHQLIVQDHKTSMSASNLGLRHTHIRSLIMAYLAIRSHHLKWQHQGMHMLNHKGDLFYSDASSGL